MDRTRNTDATLATLLERSEHVAETLDSVLEHLKALNSRTGKSEVAIARLEERQQSVEKKSAGWGGGLGAVTGGLVVAVGKLLGL